MLDSSLHGTGIPFLDDMLGGGLDPGTLTVVLGATGVGKTQLGLSFLNAGLEREGRRGVVVDLTTRGDSQQHAEYAQRMFGWRLADGDIAREDVWCFDRDLPDRFTGLDYSGKPVTRANVDDDEWRRWQARLNQRLEAVTCFLYSHFVCGGRRVLVDGVEPSRRVEDSIQLQLIETIYQQILRVQDTWVARSLFMGSWLANQECVNAHRYDKDEVATMVLQTSHEALLSDLLSREIVEGDLVTNASTIILLGRWPVGQRLGRAALVLKHRGKPCSDEVIPFQITDRGLEPE